MSKEIMNLQTGHETNQTNIREMSIRKQVVIFISFKQDGKTMNLTEYIFRI